ncbi:hypothetical protein O3P69_010247 [Scylla paramamosain]|uniref:Uncharacterized protein n=1 Tax=Scylla paramamosain TaxID=85552 RepID=A0AAW0TSS4_SCYPA
MLRRNPTKIELKLEDLQELTNKLKGRGRGEEDERQGGGGPTEDEEGGDRGAHWLQPQAQETQLERQDAASTKPIQPALSDPAVPQWLVHGCLHPSLSVIFTAPSVLALLYLLLWQTYVLRLEVILVSFALTFEGIELLFALLAIITINKSEHPSAAEQSSWGTEWLVVTPPATPEAERITTSQPVQLMRRHEHLGGLRLKYIVARQSEALMEELHLPYKTSVSAPEAYTAGHGRET